MTPRTLHRFLPVILSIACAKSARHSSVENELPTGSADGSTDAGGVDDAGMDGGSDAAVAPLPEAIRTDDGLAASLACGALSDGGIVADSIDGGSPFLPGGRGIFTAHNDNFRTGWYAHETVLTAATVASGRFGKLFSKSVDGHVNAQPLYVPDVAIPGKGTHNVVYVVTAHDTAYAFDANDGAALALWQRALAGEGATAIPGQDTATQNDGETGITGTPVIDPASGTMYLVAAIAEHGGWTQRLHALDIMSGSDRVPPVNIGACVAGSGGGAVNGVIGFDALLQMQRPGLLLANGRIYIGFGSHNDLGPYHGWFLAYDAASLAPVATLNVTPNGGEGGIWQSAGAPAADAQGRVFVSTGNGDFDFDKGGANLGDSVLALSPGLTVLDSFTPYSQSCLDAADLDLGSSGPLLIPDQEGAHPHLFVTGAKDGKVYLLDRDKLGGYSAQDAACDELLRTDADDALQVLIAFKNPLLSSPAFWKGPSASYVYVGGLNEPVVAFRLGASGLTEAARTPRSFAYPGSTPSVSSDGSNAGTGILWVIDRADALRAYDAANIGHPLYVSSPNGADALGKGAALKFTTPTIADGQVFVGTASELVVYGLR